MNKVQLTSCQLKAKDEIEKFLNDKDPDNYEYTLVGFAGTGKTFLLNYLLENFKERKAVAAAISHPAKNILLQNMDSTVECYTVAQLLGMKQEFVYGKEVFVVDRSYKKERPITKADIIIIDESSMIDMQLLNTIRKFIPKHSRQKIIYSGDSAQLPPVNKDNKKQQQISPTFNIPSMSVLYQIVRYGDLIGKVGLFYRQLIEYVEKGGSEQLARSQLLAFRPQWATESEVVWFTDSSSDFLTSALQDFYKSKIDTRIIAYRNETIDSNNDVIRPYFFDSQKAYTPGEHLILNRPYKNQNVILHNGTVLEILEVEETLHKFPAEHPTKRGKYGQQAYIKLMVWKLLVKPVNVSGGEEKDIKPVIVYAVHEDSRETYEDILKEMVDISKNESSNYWRNYAIFKDMTIFASRYYCVSCYKAQGQSIENTYVMMSDIMSVSKISFLTALRSLYVSVTRAKKKCIVLI